MKTKKPRKQTATRRRRIEPNEARVAAAMDGLDRQLSATSSITLNRRQLVALMAGVDRQIEALEDGDLVPGGTPQIRELKALRRKLAASVGARTEPASISCRGCGTSIDNLCASCATAWSV